MAFQSNPLNVVNAQSDESWRSSHFVNLSLPTKGNGAIQLDAIKLKDTDPNHKKIIQWLEQDPEKNTKIMLKALVGNFRSATKQEVEFDFIK